MKTKTLTFFFPCNSQHLDTEFIKYFVVVFFFFITFNQCRLHGKQPSAPLTVGPAKAETWEGVWCLRANW